MSAISEVLRLAGQVQAFHTEMAWLRGQLENDPLWAHRDQLPEPMRSDFYSIEANVLSSQLSAQKNYAALMAFKERMIKSQQELDAGATITPEGEAMLAEFRAGAEQILATGAPALEALRGLVNTLRAIQKLPPLDPFDPGASLN